jgi:hypothetical protein
MSHSIVYAVVIVIITYGMYVGYMISLY